MPTTTLGELMRALRDVKCDALVASAAAAKTAATARGNDNDDDVAATVVAENVPAEVWNALAEREELPHLFRLQSLMWHEGTVSIVEYPVSPEHGAAEDRVSLRLRRGLNDWVSVYHNVAISMTGRATYQPDAYFHSCQSVIGAQPPANLDRNVWATVIVEIMRNQTWSMRPKIDAFRTRPGVEYIVCIKMSLDLHRWSYEFHDLGGGNLLPDPSVGELAPRHRFNLSTVPEQHPHVLTMASRRVLGLAPGANLPPGCRDQVHIDLVEVVRTVMAEFG